MCKSGANVSVNIVSLDGRKWIIRLAQCEGVSDYRQLLRILCSERVFFIH